MKKIHIYIIFVLFLVFGGIASTYASSDTEEKTQTRGSETTQHPPHDHHEPDHIKKLDEGLQRRRRHDKKEAI